MQSIIIDCMLNALISLLFSDPQWVHGPLSRLLSPPMRIDRVVKGGGDLDVFVGGKQISPVLSGGSTIIINRGSVITRI